MIEVAYWDGYLLHRTPFCPAEIKDLPVVVGGRPWLLPPGDRALPLPAVWHDCQREDLDGEHWRTAAVCFGVDGWWDLPSEIQREDCMGCPVATECLVGQLDAVRHNTWDFGTWGGLDAGARHRVRLMVRSLLSVDEGRLPLEVAADG